jgi:hypothetical protein
LLGDRGEGKKQKAEGRMQKAEKRKTEETLGA